MENEKSMLLGGEHSTLNVYLKKPMILFPGDRFQIRETLSLTSCTGVITKLLPKNEKRILGFNEIQSKSMSRQTNAKKTKNIQNKK